MASAGVDEWVQDQARLPMPTDLGAYGPRFESRLQPEVEANLSEPVPRRSLKLRYHFRLKAVLRPRRRNFVSERSAVAT